MTRTLHDYDEILERFHKDTEHHQMSVLLNKGLYRHLHFSRQSDHTWMHRYEIITTPGQLTIRGDMGTYVFSRLADMFDFFRDGRINPGYWGEKLIAVSTWTGYREYSEDMARQRIREYFDECEGLTNTAAVWQAIKDEVLDEMVIVDESLLRDALNTFRYGEFEFLDTWEWDLRDYTFQYLWCCHAIRESIMAWTAHSDIRQQVLADATADANMTTDESIR